VGAAGSAEDHQHVFCLAGLAAGRHAGRPSHGGMLRRGRTYAAAHVVIQAAHGQHRAGLSQAIAHQHFHSDGLHRQPGQGSDWRAVETDSC
jgi:hypothetical protein